MTLVLVFSSLTVVWYIGQRRAEEAMQADNESDGFGIPAVNLEDLKSPLNNREIHTEDSVVK